MSEWQAKRFWKESAVIEKEAGFAVALDGREVKTPLKNALIVPTRAMADAIAAEWDAQEEKIDPFSMPATRAANSAIEKITPQREAVIDALAEYGASDLICYRAEAPRELVARQVEAWDPLLTWAREALGAELKTVTGVMFAAQPAEALAALRAPLEAADAFELAGLHDLIMLSSSLVIGLKAREVGDPAPLWTASRVDETYQADEWGYDEEAMEAAQEKATAFAAAHRFYQLAQKPR
ncbi:MAG: ATP12 family protein [Pseudomonadota bacterium]